MNLKARSEKQEGLLASYFFLLAQIMQTIIAITLLAAAAAFLGWNFIGKKVKRAASDDKSCGPDCNCS